MRCYLLLRRRCKPAHFFQFFAGLLKLLIEKVRCKCGIPSQNAPDIFPGMSNSAKNIAGCPWFAFPTAAVQHKHLTESDLRGFNVDFSCDLQRLSMDTPTIFRRSSFSMTVSDYIMDIMESYHISRERERKKKVYIYIHHKFIVWYKCSLILMIYIYIY